MQDELEPCWENLEKFRNFSQEEARAYITSKIPSFSEVNFDFFGGGQKLIRMFAVEKEDPFRSILEEGAYNLLKKLVLLFITPPENVTGANERAITAAATEGESQAQEGSGQSKGKGKADEGKNEIKEISTTKAHQTVQLAIPEIPWTKTQGLPETEQEIIQEFYDGVISDFTFDDNCHLFRETMFVVVGHAVPTLPLFLNAIMRFSHLAVFVQKGSTPDNNTLDWIRRQKIPVFSKEDAINNNCKDIREYLAKRENLLDFFYKYAEIEGGREKKIVIIDIGGYFADSLKTFFDPQLADPQITNFRSRILGYVEDTENGHQKYLEELKQMKREGKINYRSKFPPIVSVARSEIKDSEDFNVGKALSEATDHILRVSEYTHLAENKTILVIGYGKVGSAAAEVASEKTRGTMLVCEINSVRRLKASSKSFRVVEIAEGLAKADVIISCTGEKALLGKHIKLLKDNVYISSCTSSDDEFSPGFLKALGSPISKDREGLVWRYSVHNKTINLLNGGNSVNFVQKAVHGYFIHGVLGSLLVAAMVIIQEKITGHPPGEMIDFSSLPDEGKSYQEIIADTLMKHKLRSGPKLTNHITRNKRYIPRDDEVKALKDMKGGNIINVTGGPKSGKSQVVEQFAHRFHSKYDILWRFHASSGIVVQFELFWNEICRLQMELVLLPTSADSKQREDVVKETGESKIVTIVEDLMSADPARTMEKHLSPSKGGSVTNAPQNENPKCVKDVLDFLASDRYAYLIVFDGATLKKIEEFIPKKIGKHSKVIITSAKKIECAWGVRELPLSPYGREDRFKYLLNDDNLFHGNDLKIAMEYLRKVCVEKEKEKEEEIVGLINLIASHVKNKANASSFYRLNTFLAEVMPSCPKAEGLLRHLVIEMKPRPIAFLCIFYSLHLKENRYYIRKQDFDNFGRRFLTDDITKLEEYQRQLIDREFIEEEYKLFSPIFKGEWTDLKVIWEEKRANLKTQKNPQELPSWDEIACFAAKSIVKAFLESTPGHDLFLKSLRIIKEMLDNNESNAFGGWLDRNPYVAQKLFKKLAYALDPVPQTDYLERARVSLEKCNMQNTEEYAELLEKIANEHGDPETDNKLRQEAKNLFNSFGFTSSSSRPTKKRKRSTDNATRQLIFLQDSQTETNPAEPQKS